MSMNLAFKSKVGIIPFPVQTPTYLSYKILEASNINDRLILLEKWLLDVLEWDEDSVTKVSKQVYFYLKDVGLELVVI